MSYSKLNKFASFVALVIISIVAIFLFLLFVESLIKTCTLSGNERVVYTRDNILVNVMCLIAVCALVFLMVKLLNQFTFLQKMIFVSVWVILIGTCWVIFSNTGTFYDSEDCISAAFMFSKNIPIDQGHELYEYFEKFPHQFGYIFFNEMLIRLFHLTDSKNFQVLQIVNVVCLTLIYDGILLYLKKLNIKGSIVSAFVALIIVLPSPILYCTFLYGFMPGLAFAVWAFVFQLWSYHSRDKKTYIWAALSCLSIGFAVFVKQNYLIFLVVLICSWIYIMFKTLDIKTILKTIICGSMTIALCVSILPCAKLIYEQRHLFHSNHDAMPFIAFVVMGLSTDSEFHPGWYSAFATQVYEQTNGNAQDITEKAQEEIQNRMDEFSKDKIKCLQFYWQKFISQWNETTYQCLRINTFKNAYYDENNPIQHFYNSLAQVNEKDGSSPFQQYLDCIMMFIFLMSSIGCLVTIEHKKYDFWIFGLIILGGICFYLLSEAKSQYSMIFVPFMMIFASFGIAWSYENIMSNVWPKIKDKLLRLKLQSASINH